MGKASIDKPWLKHFSEEAVNAKLEHETIYENIRKNNMDYRLSTAINYFDRKISYGELLDTADRCAASFAEMGVKKGDLVVCCSATIPEMAMALYGLNKIGAAMLALDPRRSVAEIRQFLKSSKAKIMLLIDLAYDHVSEMLKELDSLEKLVIISADNYMPPFKRMIKSLKCLHRISLIRRALLAGRISLV